MTGQSAGGSHASAWYVRPGFDSEWLWRAYIGATARTGTAPSEQPIVGEERIMRFHLLEANRRRSSQPAAALGPHEHDRFNGTCPICQRDRHDRWVVQIAAAGVAAREWERRAL